jgi:hypothetical protein
MTEILSRLVTNAGLSTVVCLVSGLATYVLTVLTSRSLPPLTHSGSADIGIALWAALIAILIVLPALTPAILIDAFAPAARRMTGNRTLMLGISVAIAAVMSILVDNGARLSAGFNSQLGALIFFLGNVAAIALFWRFARVGVATGD